MDQSCVCECYSSAAVDFLEVSVVEEVVVEMRQVEHALQDRVPEWRERYMKQVLPMLLRPTSPNVLLLFFSSFLTLE